ncbi:hypothetical protein SAMN02745117_02760 [Lampropedia hyalina DSM 16112]|uniref:Sel1 repeat-containing protein n=1 Tax=Lampropedia hyalina DSM 16112 TaxID=1122156 RepID=A0A1M5F8F1_9BURK|nr:hypothetical protein [Lampropedia hyalina]SHF87777.1 hypothetical protein SAMN02745117_02760 [Lampropedia hyalina DSM 16112]
MKFNSLHSTIGLCSAAVLTGRSERTWRRRVNEGLTGGVGEVGGPLLVPVEAVRPLLAVALQDDEVEMLVRADQGDALAQAEIGALFAMNALQAAGQNDLAPHAKGGCVAPAFHFLAQAAEQHKADAMHWQGMLHAAGLGKGDGKALAMMWIAKAAAHGHQIAQRQLAALVPGGSLSG